MPLHSHHTFQPKTWLLHAWPMAMVLSALPAPSLFLNQSVVLCDCVSSFLQTPVAPCRNKLRQAYSLGLLSCVTPPPSLLSEDSEMCWAWSATVSCTWWVGRPKPESTAQSGRWSGGYKSCQERKGEPLTPGQMVTHRSRVSSTVPSIGTLGDLCLHLGPCQTVSCLM